MPKHKVIRTYDNYYEGNNLSNLRELLDNGWIILSSTSVNKGAEYVLQLAEPEISSNCKRLKEHGG